MNIHTQTCTYRCFEQVGVMSDLRPFASKIGVNVKKRKIIFPGCAFSRRNFKFSCSIVGKYLHMVSAPTNRGNCRKLARAH